MFIGTIMLLLQIYTCIHVHVDDNTSISDVGSNIMVSGEQTRCESVHGYKINDYY